MESVKILALHLYTYKFIPVLQIAVKTFHGILELFLAPV